MISRIFKVPQRESRVLKEGKCRYQGESKQLRASVLAHADDVRLEAWKEQKP